MQHIYIVRHGQSQDNANKVVSGQRDSPLSALGQEQAHQAGRQALGLGIDLIATTPLSRARHTAEIISAAIGYPPDEILILEGLKERFQGELQGTSYAADLSRNGDFPETEDVPGVEPLQHLRQRVEDSLHQLLQLKQQRILVVCHQNVCRMLKLIAANQPTSQFFETERMVNGRILRLL